MTDLPPLPEPVKVLDPFHSSNICFGRFIGRNYIWDTTKGIGEMVPVLPKDHKIDQSNICSGYPAPYQHPMNPPPGIDKTLQSWSSLNPPIPIRWDNYTHNRYYNNAGNITGYWGSLKYHAANIYGGGGDEGNILGTNGNSSISGGGKSVVTSPGRVNTFSSPYGGVTEICEDFYKEYTEEECYWVVNDPDGGHYQDANVCKRAFGHETCMDGLPVGSKYPDCCYDQGHYVASRCFPRGIPCSVTGGIGEGHIPGCKWKDDNGDYLDPNCIDDPDGNPVSKNPDDPTQICRGRYICGQTIGEENSTNPNNLCPKYLWKTICSGWEGNTLTMGCSAGDGATCSGGFNGNYCGYTNTDITHSGDESQNVKEWRNNGFLSFPPIHITQHKPPPTTGWDPCTGEWRAESCCLWTENDLGEFAVSGKNWLPSWMYGEGSSTGSLGWENSLVGGNALPFAQADDDCLPLGMVSSRERRSLLANPYIIYKGPCCVGGCKKITNPDTGVETYEKDSRCTILTADECAVWDGHVDGQPDMDVKNSKTKWRWEGAERLAGTDFGWWACTGSGLGEPKAFVCPCGDADNDNPLCGGGMCVGDVQGSSAVPSPPNPAESVRGKMICIENMIQDPEVTDIVGVISSTVYKKGVFIPKTESTCEATRIKFNTDNYGKDSICNYANKSGIYEFKSCRETIPGEEPLEGNLHTGVNLTCGDQQPCCTCFRDWNTFTSADVPPTGTFKSICLSRSGVYRENSRCPHGGNATYLKNKYSEEGNLEIEGYRTHCHGDNWGMFGPMTCNPGKEWGAVGDSSGPIKVNPEWTCPKSDMTYSRKFDDVWGNPLLGGPSDCLSTPSFGTYDSSFIFTPKGLGNISQVAAGNDFSVVLKEITPFSDASKSNILMWGNGAEAFINSIPEIQAKDISVSNKHILAIEYSTSTNPVGAVWAWGNNDYGQLNYPGYTFNPPERVLAKKIAASSGFDNIGANSGFSIAIDNNDNLVVWGTNGFAPTGEFKDLSIEKLPAVSGCKEIIAGDLFAYAICGSDRKVYRWGLGGVDTGITGALQIACIPYTTPDPDEFQLLVLKSQGVSFDGAIQTVGRVHLLTPTSNTSGWVPPDEITPIGLNPRIDIKQISAGYNHFLALGATGIAYAWGDNSKGQCGITNAKYGVGCGEDSNQESYCNVNNKYLSISGGKFHSIGLKNTTSSFTDTETWPISAWGKLTSTQTLNGPSVDSICRLFSGFTLSSGEVLSNTGCGLCRLVGNIFEFDTNFGYSPIRNNVWAIPGNPFDPVGYLGLNTRITWKNTCDINISGLPEENKIGYSDWYDFIITGNGTGITNLPGPMTRASGSEGRCRSHIGLQTFYEQHNEDEACIRPGIWAGCPRKTLCIFPKTHSRETTYSGPCWPCPQLYDSIGSESFMYHTSHGLTGRDGTLPNSYIMEIKLSGASAWNPCVWGQMRCNGDGIWTDRRNAADWGGVALDFMSLDYGADGSPLIEPDNMEMRCCGHSVPGYQDQIRITNADDMLLACPNGLDQTGQCWRCPGWEFQWNPDDPLSRSWDGTPASKKYYDWACLYDSFNNPTHGGCKLPDDAFGLPFGGICTILEYNSSTATVDFVGITSAMGSPAAGRTMCYCGADDSGNTTLLFDPTHGGPGCTFGPTCETIVCNLNPRCCDIEWNDQCAALAAQYCPACSSRQSHQECQNYHALKWCADEYNPGGWTGGKTVGLDLFECPVDSPYKAEHPDIEGCASCMKCDLPLCRHKYNCNLKCPCGTYGMDCQPTCTDPTGSYGPFIKTKCDGQWPGVLNVY